MEVENVGFLPRLIACIIDGVIQTIPIYLINYFLFKGVIGFRTMAQGSPAGRHDALEPTLNLAPDRLLLIMVVYLILIFVWSIGYYVCFWSAGGQTPGKMILGIRVISTSGEIISLPRAFLRYIGQIIGSIPLCLGFLWIIWDRDKQGWHDKIAGTLVVRAKRESELQPY
jgi:uncharacterized RDD family membrane protein YckC